MYNRISFIINKYEKENKINKEFIYEYILELYLEILGIYEKNIDIKKIPNTLDKEKLIKYIYNYIITNINIKEWFIKYKNFEDTIYINDNKIEIGKKLLSQINIKTNNDNFILKLIQYITENYLEDILIEVSKLYY